MFKKKNKLLNILSNLLFISIFYFEYFFSIIMIKMFKLFNTITKDIFKN